MFRIGIAEDDPGYQETLKNMLSRFQEEENIAFDIKMFSDGMALAEHYTPVYDILLLDISMPLLDGMKTAESIRRKDPAVLIIFITNMKQFAIESYKVEAFDYVLKPVSYFALKTKLKKALSIIEGQIHRYLLLHTDGSAVRVDIADIYYIEVYNHKLTFHTESGDFQVSASLKSCESQLDGCHFSRCNKCYLVNLSHVTYISGDTVTITNGDSLTLSRLRKKEFLLAITDYYGGAGK